MLPIHSNTNCDKTMRYFTFSKLGDLKYLQMKTADVPAIGETQILVRIKSVSMNARDITVLNARLPNCKTHNLIPLSDAAGEIVCTGRRVQRFKVGQRVLSCFFQGWNNGKLDLVKAKTALGGCEDGVLSEYKVFAETGLVPLPDYLSYEEASTLPCAAVTAWHALFSGHNKVTSTQSVLIIGTGNVSIPAIQMLRNKVHRIIVISSCDEKLEHCKQMGATDVVNYQRNKEWGAYIYKMFDGVDHVLETTGGPTILNSLQAVKYGGSIHLVGVQSGDRVDPSDIIHKNITINPVNVGSRIMTMSMLRTYRAANIKPLISEAVPFIDAPDAYRLYQSHNKIGKIIITL